MPQPEQEQEAERFQRLHRAGLFGEATQWEFAWQRTGRNGSLRAGKVVGQRASMHALRSDHKDEAATTHGG